MAVTAFSLSYMLQQSRPLEDGRRRSAGRSVVADDGLRVRRVCRRAHCRHFGVRGLAMRRWPPNRSWSFRYARQQSVRSLKFGIGVCLTVNGRQVRLSSAFDDKGNAGGIGAVAAAAVLLPAGFFMKGTNASMAVGTPLRGSLTRTLRCRCQQRHPHRWLSVRLRLLSCLQRRQKRRNSRQRPP